MFLKTPKFWKSKYHLFAFTLYPLSIIYFFFLKLNTFKQKIFKKKINIKTICIGNIYLGGTGKTPLVSKIYQNLKDKKKCCVIKKLNKNQLDEISMLKKTTFLFNPKKRLEGLIQAEKNGFEIAILDDGMQDYSFEKSKSVLCVKSNVGFGNELILPAGPLREPMSVIKNYQFAVINGNKNQLIENKLKKFNKEISIFYSKYIIKNKEKFLNRKFLAFSGIANNSDFFDLLKLNNIQIEQTISFPDHHIFNKDEIINLINLSNKKKLNIITTEKNYHNIPEDYKNNIFHVEIELEIINFEKFLNEIN